MMGKMDLTAVLDPKKVEELCEKTPWSKKGLSVSVVSGLGTVPEQFEKASKLMPEGSEQQAIYLDAYHRARDIYKQQLLSDVRKISAGKTRAELEGINERLFKLSYSCEAQDDYRSARLVYAAHMIGDWYYKNNPSESPDNKAKGAGYQQWKMTNTPN